MYPSRSSRTPLKAPAPLRRPAEATFGRSPPGLSAEPPQRRHRVLADPAAVQQPVPLPPAGLAVLSVS